MSASPSSAPIRVGVDPLAVAGFVVGIAGVLLAHPVPIGGVAVGILGVVLSTLGLRRIAAAGARGRLATAGLVLGIVAIAAAIVNGVLAATGLPILLPPIG